MREIIEQGRIHPICVESDVDDPVREVGAQRRCDPHLNRSDPRILRWSRIVDESASA
jgi:hypothetical protein